MSKKVSIMALFAALILVSANAFAGGGWSSGSSDSAMSGSSGIWSDKSSSSTDELGSSDDTSVDTTRSYYGNPGSSDTPSGETSLDSTGSDSYKIPSENDSHGVGSELMDENPLDDASSSGTVQ